MNNLVLTDAEKERYHRQMILPEWGEENQQKLKNATVFIAGIGGLGSPVAMYLAAAGIGNLRICDAGEPELSNLNRQILHSDADIGKKKVLSAQETLAKINPHVNVICLPEKIESTSIARLVGNAQMMIDCLDNFEARYVLNTYAVSQRLPFIHAGVYGTSGQLTFIHPPETPCLQCIFPNPPSAAGVFPVVGATPGVIGSLEAMEALKYFLGREGVLKNRLLIWEGDVATFDEIVLAKNPTCPVCGHLESRDFR
jgi:adenylyltransferase/sulfurtransferase